MEEQLLMQDFCLISGLSEEEAEQWRPLVLGCWEELKGRLRQSVRVEEHQARLALASAALANHRYQAMQGTISYYDSKYPFVEGAMYFGYNQYKREGEDNAMMDWTLVY